jgi:hypothetical protein
MVINKPYLLFLGDASDQLAAKTAEGVAFWRPSDCVGQMRLPGCSADLRLPNLTIAEAAELGAKTLLIGVANRGWKQAWISPMVCTTGLLKFMNWRSWRRPRAENYLMSAIQT